MTKIINPEITYLDVIDHWNIEQGDVVLLSSDITDLFYLEIENGRGKPSANLFIDRIIQKIGPEGTLILPTYNWDFCHGVTFDWRTTRGKTGVLGNVCLRRPDFRRTRHPLYSCAVYGRDQQRLCDMDYVSSFGADSIFAYLARHHAKNVIINLPLTQCFTYLHHVEESCAPLPYRYLKYFTAEYIAEDGTSSQKTVSMLVRDLDLDVQTSPQMEQMLLDEGIMRRVWINGIQFSFFDDMSLANEVLRHDIQHNRSRRICTYIGQ